MRRSIAIATSPAMSPKRNWDILPLSGVGTDATAPKPLVSGFCLAPEELASRRVFGRFSFSQEQASHHVGGYATQDGLKQAQEPFEFNYQLDRHCSKTRAEEPDK